MTRFPPNDPAAAIAWLKKLARRKKPDLSSTRAEADVAPANILKKLDSLARGTAQIGHEPYLEQIGGEQFLYQGAHSSDETYICDPLGMLNISKAWRRLRSMWPQQMYRVDISESLLHQLAEIAADNLEITALQTMTEERRASPVMFANDTRGLFLIDGNHRVLARAMNQTPWVRGFILSGRALEEIKVRVWKISDDGTRTEVDTTKGYIS